MDRPRFEVQVNASIPHGDTTSEQATALIDEFEGRFTDLGGEFTAQLARTTRTQTKQSPMFGSSLSEEDETPASAGHYV
ncbi:MAG: hypothetical protein WD645_07020 [Dehalococcoidia bacterium]